MNFDLFYPDVTIAFPLIIISLVLIKLFIIYYVTLYKTELIMIFLRVEKYLKDVKMKLQELV